MEDARDCLKAGFVFIITQRLPADRNDVTYKEAKCSFSQTCERRKHRRITNKKSRKKTAVKKTASMMYRLDLACLRIGLKCFKARATLETVCPHTVLS